MTQDDDDDDAARRRQEINLFAAMARGGSFYDPTPIVPSPQQQQQEEKAGEEEGGGDDESVTRITDPTTTTTTNNDGDNAAVQEHQQQQQQQEQQSSSTQDSAAMFREAANAIENTGTFAMSSLPKDSVANSNLEAAAAALAGEDPHLALVSEPPNFKPPPATRIATERKEWKPVRMHAERVLLPRTLFFGPLLPPHVLQQCQRLVAQAMDAQHLDRNDPQLLSKLPPPIRNLIGVIDTYGYGLSAIPNYQEEESKVNKINNDKEQQQDDFYVGSPYLWTIQPVWGDITRAERELERKRRKIAAKRKKQNDQNRGESESKLMVEDETLAEDVDTRGSLSERNLFASWATGGQQQQDDGSASLHPREDDDDVDDDGSGPNIRLEDFDSEASIEFAAPPVSSPLNDKDLFSQIARGEVTEDTFNSSIHHTPEQSQFSAWARGSSDADSTTTTTTTTTAVSEQSRFSQWARDTGRGGGGSFVLHHSTTDFGTFREVNPIGDDSDDDDSVVGSELKKKVGMNEHLDAALASFAADPSSPAADVTVTESITAEESAALLSHLGQTTPGGRPLTNLEMTNGCVPLYGCDDPALPSESDLGIHETKEDQIRSLELRRTQEIVEKYATPDIFGPVACPNPATNPDDNHSWQSRTTPSIRPVGTQPTVSGHAVGNGLLPVPESPMLETRKGIKSKGSGGDSASHSGRSSVAGSARSASSTKSGSSKRRRGHGRNSRYSTYTRHGWWNTKPQDDTDGGNASAVPLHVGDLADQDETEMDMEVPLQLPPTSHSADRVSVITGLSPTPEDLKKENFPLSHLHAATSMANSVPFLSDRPPSWRYLQIDTKAVGFQSIEGEIEPLFCSLAIYHVETVSSNGYKGSAPAPNVEKCGRITEALHFDVVTDEEVEGRCSGSIWPYLTDEEKRLDGNVPEERRTQGTRCGLFPVPSNYNIANLYAILIVGKVASEGGATVYMGEKDATDPKGTPPRAKNQDTDKLRGKAEVASDRHGHFLTPFSFGVAPLLQVFGTDVPSVPSSRAVQIPLFQLTPGQGERPIIDHIMVMLYPRYVTHATLGRPSIWHLTLFCF